MVEFPGFGLVEFPRFVLVIFLGLALVEFPGLSKRVAFTCVALGTFSGFFDLSKLAFVKLLVIAVELTTGFLK